MCQVEITGIVAVRAAGSDAVSAIKVVGTATDCEAVEVTLWIDGAERPPVPAQYLGPASSDAPRPWVASVAPDPPLACGAGRVRARATCKRHSDCADDFPDPPAEHHLACTACPAVARTWHEVGPCGADGKVRVDVFALLVTSDAGAVASWNPGPQGTSVAAALTPLAPDRTTEVSATLAYPPDTSQTATLSILSTAPGTPAQCEPVTLHFDVPQRCGPCPDAASLELVRVDGGVETPVPRVQGGFPCLAPGTPHELRVVQPPRSAGLHYGWSPARGGSPPSGDRYPIVLDPGETVAVSVVVSRPGCPTPPPGVATLTACVQCDGTSLALALHAEGAPADAPSRGQPALDDEHCLPPGRYVVRVVDPGPLPPGSRVRWTVNGAPRAEAGAEIVVDATAAGADVTVIAANECGQGTLRFTTRACPDVVGIELRDPGGAVVDVSDRVTAARYVAFAVPPEHVPEGATLRWRWRDEYGAGGSLTTTDARAGFEVLVTSPPWCDGAPRTFVTLDVTHCDDACPPRAAHLFVRVPERDRVCIWCDLLRIAVLVLWTVTAIGLSIWLCPGVLINPIIERVVQALGQDGVAVAAKYRALVYVVAPRVGMITAIVAGLLAFAATVVWWVKCRYSRCHVQLLVWQLAGIAGLAFVYFGACLECGVTLYATVWIGAALLIVAVWQWLSWVDECRPTACHVAYEMGVLGVAQSVVGILEIVFQTCVWGPGTVLISVVTLVLQVWGLFGIALACRINLGGRGGGLRGE
jgi:hypothetical protein